MLQTFFVYGTGRASDLMVRGGVTCRLVTDHLGSVRRVVNVATGDVVSSIDYDSFGRVLPTSSNVEFQPFGFAGGVVDHATGLVRFGARDYDPDTGRWTARDPIGFGGGDANLYAYCGSDPVNYIDASGLAFRIPEQPDTGPELAEEAAMFWAEEFLDPCNSIFEDIFYFTMGSLASLRTPDAAPHTATVFAFAFGMARAPGLRPMPRRPDHTAHSELTPAVV